MAEKLALKQGMGNRRAIRRYKSALPAWARIVDRLGNYLLARAPLPSDQDVQSIGASSFISFSAAMNCGLDPIKSGMDSVPLPASTLSVGARLLFSCQKGC